MDEVEIYNTAREMKKMFEGGARMASEMHADKALGQSDAKACNQWKRVATALRELEEISFAITGKRVL